MMSRCPDDPAFARLSRLLAGRLADDDARTAEAHLAKCEVCGTARAALERDHRLLSVLSDVPTTAAARAADIVELARGRGPARAPRMRVAALVAVAAAVATIAVLWAPWTDRAIPVPGLHRPDRGTRIAEPSRRPALAAVVAVAAGMPAPDLRADAPIVVPDGAQLVLTIGDGGIAVLLDGGSRARLLSEPGRLVVALEAGDVECRVSHRPPGESFAVRTRGVEAIVVGTRFRVSAARNDVVVLEGRVEVRRPGRATERIGPVAGATVEPPSPWLAAGSPCGPDAGRDGGQLTIAGPGRLRIDGRLTLPAPATLRCAPGTLRLEHLDAGRVASVVVRAGESVRISAATPSRTPPRAEDLERAPVEDDPVGTARRLIEEHEYAAARSALERHLAAHDGDMTARYLLGEAQRLSGDADGARVSFERVSAGASGLLAANALNRLALLAERRGPAEALSAWDRYLARAPSGPVAAEALLHRANALVALGRRAEARATLQDFIARFPSHPRRAEVERRLGTTP